MRIVFMGSPSFAVPSLEALASAFSVLAVVTQPDRRAGRGQELQEPAVKAAAANLGITVLQPHKLSDPGVFEALAELAPDLIAVAAYGQILRQKLLDLPVYGSVNVHASILPRWRGAAPVQAAILHGDRVTGITIMRMDAGLDTGPILAQRETEIGPKETGGQLEARLAKLGAALLVETLPAYFDGTLAPQPQDDSQATYAPMLKKADGKLDFSRPAEALARQVRAFEPWPRSFFHWQGERILVTEAAAESGRAEPGTVVAVGGQPAIGTAAGLLRLIRVQPAGRRAMDADAFVRGSPDFIGNRVDSPSEPSNEP